MAHIFSINQSKGGVPKLASGQAQVTRLGLADDKQRHHSHGGENRALCLYALELILKLQGEGHPIFPGSAGENITVAGLDWSRVEPGMKLRLGDTVEIEITEYTTPCKVIQDSFADHKFSRILQKLHPGESRVYAKVLTEGDINVGDAVSS